MKKGIYLGVLMAVLCWAMGLTAFVPVAHATTIAEGDLVKVAGSSATYLIQGSTKRVFPHAAVYHSWGYPADYHTVKTVTSSEISGYTDGAPVPFRDGSMFRGTDASIHGADESAVFVVEDTKVRPIISSTVYQALYNDPAWTFVTWVPDNLLSQFNYELGDMVENSDTHTDGTLIKYAGDDTVYVLVGGVKRAFSSTAALEANGYMRNGEYMVPLATVTETYTSGDTITGVETALTTPGTWDSVAVTGDLTVSLAADTPAQQTIPTNGTAAAANVAMTKVAFTAGTNDVTITGLKVTRSGLSNDAAIDVIKLFDGATQLGTSQSLNSSHQANFSGLSVLVAANTTKTLTLAATMTVSALYDGNILILGIANASDVTTTATVSGLFPIYGNSATINTGITIGTATLYNGSLGTRNTTDLTVDTDAADIMFTQIKITAGSAEGLNISQITAVKNGTAANTDVTNIKLVNDTTGETLATVDALDANGRAVFNVDIDVAKGKNVELSVLADMNNSGAGRTIGFDLHDGSAYTIMITGDTYGFGITPSRNNFCAAAGTCQTQTINQGYLTVNLASDTAPTGYIAPGGSQVELATLDFVANGEPVNVTNTAVKITVTTAAIGEITNVTMYDENGNIVAGPQDPVTSGTAFNLTDSYTVQPGTHKYTFKADIDSGCSSNDQVYFSMAASAITAKGANSGKTTYTTSSGSTVPPAATVTGKTQTVKAGALSVVTAATPIAGNLVINAQDATFAYFDLDASAGGENVRVSSITVTDTLGSGTDYSGVNNLELWGDPDTSDGVSQNIRLETTSSTSTNANTVAFTFKTPIIVATDVASRLTLKADILATTGTSHTFKIANTAAHVIVTGADTGNAVTESTAGTGQAQTIQSVGLLKVNAAAGRAAAAQFVAGTTGNSMMSYKFQAEYEEIGVTDFYIATTASANANVDRVKLYLDGVQIGQTNGYTLDNGGDAHIVLNSGVFIVPKSPDYITLDIKVDLANKANLTDAGTLEIGIGDSDYNDSGWGANGAAAAESYGMVATGVSSGTTLTATTIDSLGTSAGNVIASYVHYLYDGILTASLNSSSPSGTATAGTNKEMIRIDLTATGDDITIEDLEVVQSGTCDPTGTTAATWKSPDGTITYESFTAGTAWLDEASVSVSVNGGDAFTLDIVIPAGETKTISFFGDTTGCTVNETLQFSVNGSDITSGIEWENSTANDVDSTLTKNLPITGGTFVY
ncbi:MAG: hypothetical protein PHS07_00030 [Patescibacteria group bacterium]|nr:hypothetical protein [Patescibacteria group bacterium]